MPVCIKLSEILLNLDEEQKKNFISTAVENGYDYFVDLRADEIGLTRKQATFAEVPVLFTGKKLTKINANTIVSTKDNRLYYLIDTITLDENGLGIGICRAQKVGSSYNVKAGEICYLPVKYAGLISVENQEEYHDAYDEETNEALYQRYLDKVRYNSTSGNVYHYREWCMSITGVGYCTVMPLWNGAGTVKCVIADSNNQPASESLINTVKAFLDKEAPIGADVTVSTYERYGLNIFATISLNGELDIEEIKNRYKNSVEEYLSGDVLEERFISYAKMLGLLVNIIGVKDCTDMKLQVVLPDGTAQSMIQENINNISMTDLFVLGNLNIIVFDPTAPV